MSPLRIVLLGILLFVALRAVRKLIAAVRPKLPSPPPRKAAAPLEPARAERVDGQDPHVVLGLEPEATKEEIRAAYQRLIKEYHPDKVATTAPEIRELAERRTRQINRAYEILTRDQRP